jgi:hypothetical protein
MPLAALALLAWLAPAGAAANTPPVANNQAITVVQGSNHANQYFMLSYTDPDASQTKTFTCLTQPARGTVAQPFGTTSYFFTYTPQAGYTGADAFTWKMNDGTVDSNVATVSITVNPNTAPVANNQPVVVVQGSNHANQYFTLSYTDPDAYQTRTFTYLTQPAHGTVQPSGATSASFTYTPQAGYTGADAFTWKVSDGTADSTVATVSITVNPNTAPQAQNQRVTVFAGQSSGSKALAYVDPDPYQTRTFALVNGPGHGQLTSFANGFFTYAPDAGFTGLDAFTWKVSDNTSTSNTATCTLQVRQAGVKTGLLVEIVVHSGLYLDAIQAEVDRLKADLEDEGWTAVITPWSGGDLWDHLKDTYDHPASNPGGAQLNGAILIAVWGSGTLRFWDMHAKGDGSAPVALDIWVSQFQSTAAVELKNALDANHGYRTGRSRLPWTTWYVSNPEFYYDNYEKANLPKVWPGDVQCRNINGDIPPITEPMTCGGEYLNRDGHNTPGLPDGPHQIRTVFIGGCGAGASVSTYQSARGGGNLISVGGFGSTYSGTIDFANELTDQRAYLLNNGESWGQVLLTLPANSQVFGGPSRNILGWFGDLSIGAKMSPANQLPAVTSYAVSSASPMAGEPVTFTLQANDPDAGTNGNPAVNYSLQAEWFLAGRDKWGAIPPTATDSTSIFSWTLQRTHVFDRAHVYQARVEVMDAWRARTWQDVIVQVRPDPASPLRIRCGWAPLYGAGFADPRIDLIDSQGRLWLHDHYNTGGPPQTWYCKYINEYYFLTSTAPVAGTEDDALYQTAIVSRQSNGPVEYRVPVRAGTYRVRLHFADMWSAAPGRKTDVTIAGTQVLDGYDVVADVGPKTAVVKEFPVTAGDGWLSVVMVRNAASVSEGILNALEVLPAESEVTVTLAAGYTLIAPPLNPSAPLTAEGLAQQINAQVPSPQCTSVIAYEGGAFVTHPAGTALNNFPIEKGKGYFVRCATAGAWKAKGYRFGVSRALVPVSSGYNLVGLPLEPGTAGKYTAESAAIEMNAQGGGATQLIRYDETAGQFVTHPVGTALQNFPLDPGRGYFLRCTKDSVWTVSR